MARNIGADGSTVYRAVITFANADGTTTTRHEGPYGKVGAARARVSFWRNYLTDPDTGESTATGHIERAVTTWERVQDGEQQ
jgi:hypothetical protein